MSISANQNLNRWIWSCLQSKSRLTRLNLKTKTSITEERREVKVQKLGYSLLSSRMMRYENKLGGTFEPGRPISFGCRKRILNLYQTGYNASQISQRTCVTKPCVIKLIKQYNTWGSMKPFQKSGKLPQKTTDEVLAFIELQARLKPSIYGREIRRKLINIGEFTNSDAPSVSWINKVIHNKLNMTSKGISELPK